MDSVTVTFISLEAITGFIAVFGNIIVCYVILNSYKLRRKIMYMFVTSLAIADLSVGLLAIPFAILTKLGLPHNSPTLCIAMLSFVIIPTQVSVYNLMAISIERYIAIKHPGAHRVKLTVRKAHMAIAFTWILCTIIGFLPIMGWRITESTTPGVDEQIGISELQINNFTKKSATVVTDVNLPGKTSTVRYGMDTSPGMAHVVEDVQCIFVLVIDPDYLTFIFLACAVPSLLTSAVLYFLIYLRVSKAYKTTSTKVQNMKQDSGDNQISAKSFRYINVSKFIRASLNYNYIQNYENVSPLHNSTSYVGMTFVDIDNEKATKPGRKKAFLQPVSGSETSFYDVSSQAKTSQEVTLSQESCFEESEAVNTTNENFEKEQKKEIADDKLSVRNTSAISGTKEDESNLSHERSQVETPESGNELLKIQPSEGCSSNTVNRKKTLKPRSNEKQNRKRAKEIRATAVLGIIVLIFAICWLPIHFLNAIVRLAPSARIPISIFDVAILLSHANSAVNFFLYSWRLKVFRVELNKSLKKIKLLCCSNQ